MARTTLTAPAHVVLQRSPGQFTNPSSTVSPDAATSFTYAGSGLLDHRMASNKYNAVGIGNGAMAANVGWATDSEICVMDATPTAAATANIAALQNVTSGTPLTLTAGTGVSALAAPYTMMPFGTVAPTGAIAMGTSTGTSTTVPAGCPGYMFIGIRDVTAFYDPTTAITYALSVTGVAGGTGGAFIVRGFDFYGQPMSETITATAGATTANGVKAWKIVSSITPQFTDAHNYSFGTQLVVGLHIACDYAAYMFPYVNGAGYTTNPSITASLGSTTINTAATATNADVRGTFVPTAVRTVIYVTPSQRRVGNPNSLGGASVGFFGVPQFTQ